MGLEQQPVGTEDVGVAVQEGHRTTEVGRGGHDGLAGGRPAVVAGGLETHVGVGGNDQPLRAVAFGQHGGFGQPDGVGLLAQRPGLAHGRGGEHGIVAAHHVDGAELQRADAPAHVLGQAWLVEVVGVLHRQLGDHLALLLDTHALRPQRFGVVIDVRAQPVQSVQGRAGGEGIVGVDPAAVGPFVVARGVDQGVLAAVEHLQPVGQQDVGAALAPALDVTHVQHEVQFGVVQPGHDALEPLLVQPVVGGVTNEAEGEGAVVVVGGNGAAAPAVVRDALAGGMSRGGTPGGFRRMGGARLLTVLAVQAVQLGECGVAEGGGGDIGPGTGHQGGGGQGGDRDGGRHAAQGPAPRGGHRLAGGDGLHRFAAHDGEAPRASRQRCR